MVERQLPGYPRMRQFALLALGYSVFTTREDIFSPARIGSRRARQMVELARANDTGACCNRIGRFSPAGVRSEDDS